MKKMLYFPVLFFVAALFFLGGCSSSSPNVINDTNNYNIRLNVDEYVPAIDPAKYQQYAGLKMCLSNIRNDARNTSNFTYHSKDMRVRYEMGFRDNSIIMMFNNYLWYSYQKALAKAGIEAANCSTADKPELWIIIQSYDDEEIKLKLTLLKNRTSVYEKEINAGLGTYSYRSQDELTKRAFAAIDATVAKILDDPGLREEMLKK